MAINFISPSTLTTAFLIGDTSTYQGGSSDSLPQLTQVGGQPVSAAIEIQSTSGALLVSRMTNDQRDDLNEINGMVIYSITDTQFQFYQNGGWFPLTGGGGGGIVGPGASTVNAIATWADAIGDSVQNSNVLVTTNGTDNTTDDLNLVGIIAASKTAGLVGTPNYTFTGDVDTGIWSSADNVIDFSAAGIRQLQIINDAGGASTSWLTLAASTTGAPTIGVSGANANILLEANGTGAVQIQSDGGSGNISIYNAAAANHLNISASTLTASYNWTLPATASTGNNQPLVSNAAGALSFLDVDLSTVVTGPNGTVNTLPTFSGVGTALQDTTITINNGTKVITGLQTIVTDFSGTDSAANPSYTFQGDLDTGFFHNGANNIGITASGALQFAITGTASATGILTYVAGAGVNPQLTSSTVAGAGGLDIHTVGSTAASALRVYNNTAGNPAQIQLFDENATNYIGLTTTTEVSSNTVYQFPAATAGDVNSYPVISSFSGGVATIEWTAGTTFQTTVVTVSSAELKALHATPVTLVPAQGVGNIVTPLYMLVTYFYGTTPYTTPSGSKLVVLVGPTQVDASNLDATGLFGSAISVNQIEGQALFLLSAPYVASAMDNQPVLLQNNNATEFTAGDGTLSVTTYYQVFPSGLGP